MNLKALTEAILFAIGDAVSVDEICIAAGDENKKASAQDIKDILKELANDYENENRGIRLIELNGKYQLCTKKDYYNALIRIVNMPEKHTLTDVLLETLSIVAYKQPVTRAEIEKIRGVSCSHAINRLIEYNLVDEVGFEPPVPLRVRQFSKLVVSATHPHFLVCLVLLPSNCVAKISVYF